VAWQFPGSVRGETADGDSTRAAGAGPLLA
jgi:hypothetical protein